MRNNIHEPVVAEHTPLPEHGANPVPPGATTLPVHAFCCAPTTEMRTERDNNKLKRVKTQCSHVLLEIKISFDIRPGLEFFFVSKVVDNSHRGF